MSKSLWGKLYTQKKRKRDRRDKKQGEKPCGNGDAGVTVLSEAAEVVVMTNQCIH